MLKVPEQITKDIQYISITPPWVKYTIGGLIVLIVVAFFVGSWKAKRYDRQIDQRDTIKDTMLVTRAEYELQLRKLDTAFQRTQMYLADLYQLQQADASKFKALEQQRKANETTANKAREDLYNPSTSNQQLQQLWSDLFNDN